MILSGPALASTALLTILALTSCTRDHHGEVLPSDSGEHVLWTTVNRTEPARADHGAVLIHVQGRDQSSPVVIDSHASDGMQWHVGWADGDTIVLWSSDIGNRAWVLRGRMVVEVPVTSSLNEQADWMKGP